MSRKEFGYLLQQYLAGKCTEEEKSFVEHWFALVKNEERNELTSSDLDKLEPLLWERIQNEALPEPSGKAPASGTVRRNIRAFWLTAAAAAAALLTVFAWKDIPVSSPARVQEASMPEITRDWIKEVNTTGQSRQVRLPDGSEIMLSPESAVEFPRSFLKDKREVLFTGEAFFNIARMENRPFYIYTDNVVTKVLGTSFYIRAKDRDNVAVEVVTGLVAVYKRTPQTENREKPEEVILSPNQKTVYSRMNQEFVTALVDEPMVIPSGGIANEADALRFEETPLVSVLKRLEEAYGITITLKNPRQEACPLTADLTGLPLYDQLDMICAATKSRYQVSGTTITISGEGCSNL